MIRIKYCAVPLCPNTTRSSPDKLFITIPQSPEVRQKWCAAMKRSAFGRKMSDKSVTFVCEDHFDLHEDMENYMEYKLMGPGFSKIRMKKDIVPHKFECQTSRLLTSEKDVSHKSECQSSALSSSSKNQIRRRQSKTPNMQAPVEVFQLIPEQQLYENIQFRMVLPTAINETKNTRVKRSVTNVQTSLLKRKRRRKLYFVLEDCPQLLSSPVEEELNGAEFIDNPDIIPNIEGYGNINCKNLAQLSSDSLTVEYSTVLLLPLAASGLLEQEISTNELGCPQQNDSEGLIVKNESINIMEFDLKTDRLNACFDEFVYDAEHSDPTDLLKIEYNQEQHVEGVHNEVEIKNEPQTDSEYDTECLHHNISIKDGPQSDSEYEPQSDSDIGIEYIDVKGEPEDNVDWIKMRKSFHLQ